jgi:hypothetical protein
MCVPSGLILKVFSNHRETSIWSISFSLTLLVEGSFLEQAVKHAQKRNMVNNNTVFFQTPEPVLRFMLPTRIVDAFVFTMVNIIPYFGHLNQQLLQHAA